MSSTRTTYVVDTATGWLNGARRVPSPNFNERPVGTNIDLLIIHNISLPPGQFGGRYVEHFFTNQLTWDEHPFFETIQDVKVSSHLFIRRKGEVVQFVPFNMRAWHAGQSCFGDRESCNDFSIGIELEGCDDQPFDPRQYRRLGEVARALMRAFPAITPARIVGHSDIAPGRKTDPGPHFDWLRLHAEIGSLP